MNTSNMTAGLTGTRRRVAVFMVTLALARVLGAAEGGDAWWEQGPPAVAEKAIAAVLSVEPIALGALAGDRKNWEVFARTPAGKAAVRSATTLLATPLPEGTDEVYLALQRDYSPENRRHWDQLGKARRDRVVALTLAECIEQRGRFLPALEATMRSLCAERAWVFPGYDRELCDYQGTRISIDLFSSKLGWNLATADRLLGERLAPDVRRQVRHELQRRIFVPFRRMIAGEQPAHWLKYANNWVSVCLAGVTGAALALLDSPEERAFFVRAAAEQSWSFVQSYTADGYCSEGVGYWNYGFGHYVFLSGLIHKATGGRIDLLARKPVYAGAAYGARIELAPGISPSFADADPYVRLDARLMNFVNHRFGFGRPAIAEVAPALHLLGEELFYGFEASGQPRNPAGRPALPAELHSWFPLGGVYVGRPAPGSASRLAVALKGGHNAEQHNHNDVGSYVVLVGRRAVLLDPGQETRTGRTFSARRYESNLLNSFGHPVPRIADTLQATGAQARAELLETRFSAAHDTISLDLRSAYPVAALRKLTRTFRYDREGAGAFTVVDDAVAAEPVAFETALITLGQWRQTGPATLQVEDSGEAVEVVIDAQGERFTLVGETVAEERRGLPRTTRIAIRLERPVRAARVEVRITPVPRP